MKKNQIKYSIIIPTYNEENVVENLLLDLKTQTNRLNYQCEIILTDGGSFDKTIEIASNYDVKIISSEKGRGSQLVKGAEIAKGNILFFLHADSKLPENVFLYLDWNLKKNTVSSFMMKHDNSKLLYKVYSFFTKFDSVFTTFWDQGIILTKELYLKLGGFTLIPIMEDVEFLIQARKKSKINKLNNYLTTSTRKFEEEGIIINQIKSFILIVKYLMGTNTEKIYDTYYNEKSSNSIYKISRRRKGKNQISFNNK